MSDQARNVETLRQAYSRWSETKGGSVDEWLEVCADDIAFVHDAGTDAQKARLFRRVREGQVRVLVRTQRWTAPNPTPFSTWGNLMKLVYDAP